MREVAEMAHVSVQTVSHVVNETGRISDGTRERVHAAITALNYRPHTLARSMRTQQTRLIGLLVLDITNPILSRIASGIEDMAHTNGYRVLLYNALHDARLERESLESFSEHLVDGLIIINAVDQASTFDWLESGAIPTVLIDSISRNALPSVQMDNHLGAYLATEHLIRLGHQRIAHLAGDLTRAVAQRRVEGYRQALKDHDLAAAEIVVPASTTSWNHRSGYEAMRQLLERPDRPTAVFAAGDQMAIGAYRALAEQGIGIPDDISVVGFDDIEAASFTTPPLTTVRQPLDRISASAFGLLLDLLDTAGRPGDLHIVHEPELVVRASTRELP